MSRDNICGWCWPDAPCSGKCIEETIEKAVQAISVGYDPSRGKQGTDGVGPCDPGIRLEDCFFSKDTDDRHMQEVLAYELARLLHPTKEHVGWTTTENIYYLLRAKHLIIGLQKHGYAIGSFR